MGHAYEFIANCADGMFAVDWQQDIVLWNQPATEILGYTGAAVLGKKCYEIVRGRGADGCRMCRRNCQAFRSAEHLVPAPTTRIAVQTKQGHEVWLTLTTVVVPSQRDDLAVLVHLFREVTSEFELLNVVQALAAAVSRRPGRKPSARNGATRESGALDELTRREKQVLRFLTTGSSTRVIADKLGISPRTVGNHVNNILGKLDVHSRLEAVTYSIRNGLI